MTLKRVTFVIACILLVIAATGYMFAASLVDRSLNQINAAETYYVSAAARTLHSKLFVGDWHADSTLWGRNLAKRHAYGHVDLPRLQEGNVALQMFTIVTKSPSGLNYDENAADAPDDITTLAFLQAWPLETHNSLTARALWQGQQIHALAKQQDDFVLVKSNEDLQTFLRKREDQPDLVAGLLGIEGAHALDGKLANIDKLYEHGFRMMGLQHFFDNQLGGSLHGINKSGLTEFGREAVSRMLERHMIIDVSHSSIQVVEDVLEMSNRPIVVSHTGFYGHCPKPRNIGDGLMQRIADKGGIIAVGYWEGAVCGTSPTKIVEAIQYGVDLLGEDHIALGSDFDGSIQTAFDTSQLVLLTHTMLEAGFSEQQIGKVMGGNMLAFLLENLPAK